ncbi:RNA-binding protein 41 [Pseudoliparis swirei]|uniref:RNA-binding protein 41 n=1 Tax=Pseudoliparis swirei TaxID=2059687 RepID=UPI0024BDAFAB|nr:RNA-binding protein 41 [Pseudoliparis swirei]
MQRVSRRSCDDGPLLEEQETEGQRQLHGLLRQQLLTAVDIERCVAKRKCFAPAALYRPFGAQAAGVRSLSEFRALQDGETDLASLRELGLTETEILLWRSRDVPEKSHGVCAAPVAKQQRLQVIRDKMDARDELLARPQRFAASQPLSRREMEIERALFHGTDRLGFLTALYHRDEDNQESQEGASSSDPMDSLYRDVLRKERKPPAAAVALGDPSRGSLASDQSQDSPTDDNQSGEASDRRPRPESVSQRPLARAGPPPPAAPTRVGISRPIGSLRGAGGATSGGPLTVRGEIETISDGDIRKNREPEEGIRSIPRFRNYQQGNPSKVLCVKNLSAQASAAQLVALFSRFERENEPPVLYRLLTGRMKGQAFVTLPDAETAQRALQLVHGYRLLGKPLVVEFGRERREEEKQTEEERK